MSVMDLTGVIESFQTGSYTVTRAASSTYDANGRAVAGAASTFSIDACFQPATGRELQLLPEGKRGKETKVGYTATALRTQAAGAPDTISIGGSSWEVQLCEPWDELGGYYRAIVQKEGSQG